MPEYIQHPLLKDDALESRTYQEVIAASSSEENTLVVLPTGLGKTAVGILLAANRLQNFPDSKILMMAPTKPLVEQHKESFQRALDFQEENFSVITGKTKPIDRPVFYKDSKFVFSTPQTIAKDLENDRLSLEEFCLVIFDECHRAVKEYAYVPIAEKYMKSARNPRILGLTASPGGKKKKIKKVAENLYIDNYEVRTEEDPDVKEYVQEKNVEWEKVPMSKHMERVRKPLKKAYRNRLKKLKGYGFLNTTSKVSKKRLLKLQSKIGNQLSEEKSPRLFQGISIVSACLKLQHAMGLLETQGIEPLYNYFEEMKKDDSKASKNVIKDKNIQDALSVIKWMYENNKEHPKLGKLKEELKKRITGEKNAIVFTQYRNTVDMILKKLKDMENIKPVKFIGQKKGYSQDKQKEILEEFREGTYNVLVSTSIGEEGLDVPGVDYVVFYEPIPSEIRTIQRRGRTGRQKAGNIYVLMTENTRDEAFYWSSKNKEKRMKKILKDLRGEMKEKKKQKQQKSLDSFSNSDELSIYVDDRERKTIKKLEERDIKVKKERLQVADFLVSDRCAVEKKTSSDFVTSIIDNRLFDQLRSLRDQFEKPVLLVEGNNLFDHRDIHPNAIRGALSSIILDYDVPILWTSNLDETAEILVSLAKREQEDNDRQSTIRGEKAPKDEKGLQKYLICGLPSVSEKLADRLLEKFGTPKNIFTASENELQKVKGIGEGKAQKIRKILEREFDES